MKKEENFDEVLFICLTEEEILKEITEIFLNCYDIHCEDCPLNFMINTPTYSQLSCGMLARIIDQYKKHNNIVEKE